MSGSPLILPTICNEDIGWVCRVLGLPPTAFTGIDGKDPRLDVIRFLDHLDVEACPGSGKTTLLVAKLAILARYWTEGRRGICVLSHTNVARHEIERRLGSTPEGKRLLSYPHFVGTIHAFVNEFLALPWLRSKPYPVSVIDDDICLQWRWRELPWKTRSALESGGHNPNVLRMAATDFSVGEVRWGRGGTLGHDTDTYQAIIMVCRKSCEEGLFCHGEMFLWAGQLLERAPPIRRALRERFPLLFIDEVQDTSEEQSALLYRVFMQGDYPVIRQRFGDSNQAIYRYSEQTDGVTTDVFPDANLQRTIPNSYRFGQQIADLADPLAVCPHGVVGMGPRDDRIFADTTGKHAIFLFDSQTIGHVLSGYASYLLELFSELELKAGTFTAVGAVHRPGQDSKVPRSVVHYWSAYDHELAASEPRPKTFLQYLASGRKLAHASGEAHYVVEKIADGVLRLASILNPSADISMRKRKHRYVRELLRGNPEAHRRYRDIVFALIAGAGDTVPNNWTQAWAPEIRAVAAIIAGTAEDTAEATAFLAALPAAAGDTQLVRTIQRDNLYRFPPENPRVQIGVGSIHSVKGETHTAILVLDTYFHNHHLVALKPWLAGAKSGSSMEKSRTTSRLKQHYVAMTRPSHLLCLAMRDDSLSNGDISALKAHGWRVGRVTVGATVWL